MRRASRLILAMAVAAFLGYVAGNRARPPATELQEPPAGDSPLVVPSIVRPSQCYASDGDTLRIDHGHGVTESVRMLCIDAPEVSHSGASASPAQPYGDQARDFLRETLGRASRVELLRSPRTDRYRRTLAFVLIDGRNYSALVVGARLASVYRSRDVPPTLLDRAAEVEQAAREAGPPPFESPSEFRERNRAR